MVTTATLAPTALTPPSVKKDIVTPSMPVMLVSMLKPASMSAAVIAFRFGHPTLSVSLFQCGNVWPIIYAKFVRRGNGMWQYANTHHNTSYSSTNTSIYWVGPYQYRTSKTTVSTFSCHYEYVVTMARSTSSSYGSTFALWTTAALSLVVLLLVPVRSLPPTTSDATRASLVGLRCG